MTDLTTTIADRINAAHARAHDAARTAVAYAIECGQLLLKAKADVGGEWLPWVEANLSFGERQARKYMWIARHAPELLNRTCGADIGINAAIEVLAEPTINALDFPAPEQDEPVSAHVYLAERRPLEDGEIRILITDVLPAPVRARRSTVYPGHVQRLAKYLPYLPPIEINQHYELIDGWHRLEAHKEAGAKTVVAIVTPVEDEWHHGRLWVKRNSRHGIPYTPEDEKHQDQIAARLGISLEGFREEASKEALAEWWRKRRAKEDEHADSASWHGVVRGRNRHDHAPQDPHPRTEAPRYPP